MVLENREEKFKRLATARMRKIQDVMLLLQNLSYQRFYEYSDNEITELFDAYNNKGVELRKSFMTKELVDTNSLTSEFKFSSSPTSEENIKFHRLAEARLSKCFKIANTINNLSNKNNYSYSEDDVNRLFSAYETIGVACRLNFQESYIVENMFE